jgi:hypothetical protein
MTQSELNRAVAAATGESICTVSHLGFTIADPDAVDYDPEPCEVEDLIVDWDALDAGRNTPLVPALA